MMRIYEILPGKLLQSARTQMLNDQQCVDLVNEHKITGIVNLWHTADLRMQALVRWYEHESLPDGRIHGHVAEAAESLAKRVAIEIEQGGCVLVHCWGGRNRSGLINALALTRLEGITGSEALRAVRQVRRGALVNQFFINYLETRVCL